MYEITFWSLAVSGASIFILWLMGNKNKWAPVLGILGQVVWYIYAIQDRQYGLLIGITGYTIVHVRNSIKWWKEMRNGN